MTAPVTPPLPPKQRLAMLGRTLRAILRGPRAYTQPALARAHLPATRGVVELVRDRNGVSHVYADDERDLFACLGYLQAADRFVLMDLLRHAGAGRVSRLVGNLVIPGRNELFGGRRLGEIDRFLRPLDFEAESARDVERMDERVRECLEAYARGVNAALEAMRGSYPVEYLLLGEVRRWSAADCLLVQRTSGLVVSLVPMENELTFDAVRSRVGDELARKLYPDAPWHAVPTSYAARGRLPPEQPLHMPAAGSNNWAVGAGRSASGFPILANDPHVPLFPLPTYWHHVHLRCAGYEVQGGVFPGCPVFGFGHNRQMAWGCTTVMRDGWDFYRIHRLPEDPARYRTPGGTGRIHRHREARSARLGRAVVLEWESCEHGILYPGWRHHDGADLAVRYVPSDGARYLEGCLLLPAARSVEDHRRALRLMNDGPLDFNHVYAHRDGQIGWEPFGRLPRRRGDGLFVRDAHDPDAQWEGFVPFEEMPKIRNPSSQIVASANAVVDPKDFESIATTVHFEPRYRQERIEATLARRETHDAAGFCALQSDVRTDYCAPVRDALLPLLAPFAGESTREGHAFRELAAWEGDFPVESAAAALFFFTLKELGQRCFAALLGPQVGRRYAAGRRARPRLHQLLLDGADPLRLEIESAAGRSLVALARESFCAAVARVARICGDDPERWRWGRIQRARLGTLLAEIPRLGRRFVALDEPFPGDDYSVNPSRSLDEGRRLRAFVAASSRFVCDLARPHEALFAHSSGPSGDIGSLFFGNLSRSWSRFEYFRSAFWDAGDVPEPVERLTLPGSEPPESGS